MATAKTITVPVPGTIAAENPPSTVTVPRAYTIDVVVEPGNSWTVDTQTYYSGWVGNVTINPSHERLAFWTIPIGANPIALQATPLATITSPVKVADQIVLQTVQPNQLQLHVAAQSPPSVDPRSTSRVAGFPSTGTIPPVPKGTDNPNPAQPSNSSPGGNNGVVIGAAIGCLIAGLLLGFLIAFFIYRKRSQRQAQYAPPPTVVESKAFDASPPLPVVDDKLSRFLLDASPDKEITSELRSLGTLIQQHVENNYHLNPVQAERRSLTALLTQLGVTSNGNGLTQEVVANLALDPRTRQVALQHVISQVLFTSIDVSSRSRLSMLPAPIAAFLQSIPPRENGERHNEALSTALNQWRALSAFILHPSRSQRTPLPVSSAAVSPQASGLADALDTFLHYFVDDNLRFQQTSHLQAVITECTKFGYVLLSQPHEWRLVNEPGPGHHSGPHGYNAVVCAGLIKVTLRDGTPTSSPQQVVPPMTVTV